MNRTRRRRLWVPARVVLGAGLAYSAVAILFEPYTAPMRVATAAPCIVVAVVAATRRQWAEAHRPTASDGPALVVWAILIVAVLVFQLALYLSAPRIDYPTLSSLASVAFDWPAVRPAAFALWLWIGWYLLER